MTTITPLPSAVDRTIGATVRALYTGRGLRQAEVAAAAGCSTGTMSARIAGKTPWTATEVRLLADFFGVPITALYDGMNGMFPGPNGGDGGKPTLPLRDLEHRQLRVVTLPGQRRPLSDAA